MILFDSLDNGLQCKLHVMRCLMTASVLRIHVSGRFHHHGLTELDGTGQPLSPLGAAKKQRNKCVGRCQHRAVTFLKEALTNQPFEAVLYVFI